MNKPLYNDPVVEEIHKIQAQLLDDCQGNMVEFRKRLRERQAKSGRPIVQGPVGNRTEQADAAEPK